VEFKVVIYIIGAILYFFYTVGKKAEEKKKNAQATNTGPEPVSAPAAKPLREPVNKPISPPTRSPMETVVREMKRQQAEQAVQKKEAAQTLLTKETERKKAKELFIHEKKRATFGAGPDDSPVFEPSKDEQNILERDNRISQQNAYHIPSVETAAVENETAFEFDARQGFISSIIFERKY
jgi:hypothetical protein